jgi:hypothetical protein
MKPQNIFLSLSEAYEAAKYPKIMVNGILKHENNSEGQPIHHTYEGMQNFYKWFGKSKAVDKHGRPEVFYHGTKAEIQAFSNAFIGKGTDAYGMGHYFINDPNAASAYATNNNLGTPNVVPVYIKMESPIVYGDDSSFSASIIKKLIVGSNKHKEVLNDFGEVSREGLEKVLANAVSNYEDFPKLQQMFMLFNDFYDERDAETFVANLQRASKHDGVLVNFGTNTILTVFDPGNVKSAIGNRGTYSRKSHDLSEASRAA